MPADTKLNSKEFVCIDKRVGYLALFIVPAVILIVISSMVNSQKMTQNSRASESSVAIVIPTKNPPKNPPYANAVIEVCKNSALEFKFRPEITIEKMSVAAGTCVEDIEMFIKKNSGVWPGPEISPVNNESAGFQAADIVVKTWEKKGYIFERQQAGAREVVIKNLKTQREKLSPSPKFIR